MTHRLFANWLATGEAADHAAHLRTYGPLPVDRFDARQWADLVTTAGLRGRGGAGFPTGRKIHAVRSGPGRPVVVGNGCEGDPGSKKDTALLAVAPHLVLDGLVTAGSLLAAQEVILCVHKETPVLRKALAARADPVRVRIVEIPHRYVASEESALVNFLTNGKAVPTSKPPRIFERGVAGRPTLLSNVETFAQLALITRYGPNWFRAAGTPGSPGTTLVTVSGAVAEPGVYEVDFGTRLQDLAMIAGGFTSPVRAALIGGYGGSWLPMTGGLPFTHRDLRSAGATLGIAAVRFLPADRCGLADTAGMLRYLAAQSAGQCGPCMFGLPAIARDFTALCHPNATTVATTVDAVKRLHRRLPIISGRGACAHPDGAIRLASSALITFAADVGRHRTTGPCSGVRHPPATGRASVSASGQER
jgi:NADH:ubiquinone oxidoreductase subunit F (NADH-binding)